MAGDGSENEGVEGASEGAGAGDGAAALSDRVG